jgi:DNA-binding SARP family transcriptional activator/tetratricopeptide (TPR) repeat protein
VVLRVGVLGPVTAWFGGQELSVGQPRQQAVLGILAMRANRVISRGELVDAVWGHDPPASAEGGVYTYVAGLRRIIEPNRSLRGPGRVLVSSGAGYVLHLVPGQPDAVAFEQHLARARQLRKVGDPAAAVAAINAALGLWRGTAFAGVPGPFAETERARLAEMRSAAAEERADVLLSLGRHGEVVPDLTAMVADHPLRERMRGLLMIALYRSGRQAEALRVYAEGRRVLADELGIDPGSDLARVHLQVLTMDVALNVAAPVIRIGADYVAEPGQQDEPQAAADEFAVPADAGYPAESETGHRSWPGAGPRIAEHGPGVPVPAQLPLDAPGFSGRHEELGMLHAMLPSARSAAPEESVPIIVISGTAGVGKTALAVRFGRQVAKRFPDGQLYVNLRGLDPVTTPMEPGEALRFFLDSFGVPPHRIAVGPQAQAALYRSMLDGKRMLIVLDNASNAAQVRPLLPGSPGCLVVVTSRNQMAGLVAAEGAMPLTLDVLSQEEAHEMLARRLGHDRAGAEPEAADEIIEECARLPLALSITVGRAAGRPRRSLAELAAELRDARGRLDALAADKATATDVRAVLSWSYDQLSEPAARMFRLLGLHPGPDISLSAAASLAGVPRAGAGAAMRELTRTHMVAEYTPARFAFHDLLRAYAADQSERHDSEEERQAAVRRVLDHYLHTAMAATMRFSPHRSPLRLPEPLPGVLPADFSAKEQAAAWFDAEVPVLLALLGYADSGGLEAYAWQIPWTLGPFFSRRGRWQEYAVIQQTALGAARRLGEPLGLAHAHHLLGHAQAHLADYDAAEANMRRALDIFHDLEDRGNEAVVMNGLGLMYERQGRYEEALAVTLDALRMLKAVGHWWTQATLENSTGWLYAHLGQYDEAVSHCMRALSLHRESGHRGGAGDTLDSLGYIYRQIGDHARSRDYYQQAIALYHEIGDSFSEGQSLTGLGDTHADAGNPAQARTVWIRAAALLDTLPHPLADQVRGKLRDLDARLEPDHPAPGTGTTARSV